MHTLDDLEVAGRRVLVRSDLNVPLDVGRVADDGRILAALPTLRALLGRGAKVVVASHLGRPHGEVRPELSLRPVAERLAELLGHPVRLAEDSVGPSARSAVQQLSDAELVLLENVRFDPRETSKDDGVRGALAAEYAQLADAYVSDGFGVIHRKQASVYDVAKLLPNAAGLLVQSEIGVLHQLTNVPARPYAVVLGGSKVSDKLAVIANLLQRVDRMFVGGGMVYTFLAAQGMSTGRSLLEVDQIETVRGLMAEAAKRDVELVLPTDIVVAERFDADAASAVVPCSEIPDDWLGMDIGPQSRELFAARLADSATVFWNGPMGVFEFPKFADGTNAVATALTHVSGLTVVGGGDSAAAVRKLGFSADDFGHISTGGGASLEFLEGKQLPGITVLED